MRSARTLLPLLAFVLAGCLGPGTLRPPAQVPPSTPPGDHWPLPPLRAQRLLQRAQLTLEGLNETERGKTGAMRGVASFPEHGLELPVKWKPAPPGELEDWRTSPRKELAAFVIQRWFLDPDAFVVPSVGVRCIPLTSLRATDADAEPSLAQTSCVIGSLSLWLRNLRVADGLWDPERFERDGVYAYHIMNLNLLTHLLRHRDAKASNFLEATATESGRWRVFSVDHGISFETWRFNPWVWNWDEIRVPSLRRDAVERLRLAAPRLHELAVLQEFERDAAGVLQPAAHGPPVDPDRGVRVRGDRVQLGLTQREIEKLAERLHGLLEAVADGRLVLR